MWQIAKLKTRLIARVGKNEEFVIKIKALGE
jgi:hypothetical protein